ncbi:MAG: glycosyltransferase family 4 protein [Acidimicrobiales bacterium]|nr:glycosyltransferase family 4 protein [Acidimicrobiales bacterium]
MSVAVVHDHLVQRGGAERVLLSMLRAFPTASVHTSVFEPSATHPELADVDVRTGPLDRSAFCRRHHRLVAPLLAPSFSRLHLDEDLVFCSSAGWSHGVDAVRGRKLVYFHAPARWLYSREQFLGSAGPMVRLAAAVTRRPLLAWDRRAFDSIDGFLANSTETARRLQEAYGVEATVVPPPVRVDASGPQTAVPGLEPGYALVVSRLIAYKHVDAVVEAFGHRPQDRLVVVGDGPEAARIRSLAGPNVTLLGGVDEAQLRWLYASARVLVSAAHEDFGLTPTEAGAFGCPVVVLRHGGHLDTVVEGTTGAFFDRVAPRAISEAIDDVDRATWSGAAIRGHAATFDEASFAARLRAIAADLVGVDALGATSPMPLPSLSPSTVLSLGGVRSATAAPAATAARGPHLEAFTWP